ncbi:MAG: xanthine dehydrogenase FAD-binding subunit XdhB [Candidatus Adiutrix sp.]|jgi:xanthine dehydrogenase FAD-binding subunit|nr:xanthine dehydrogenase FAD-binding subunit XdhB [Candidatus Adiutrix sp.]
MFDIQHYYKAESIAQAVEMLAAHPGSRLVAGGTDVLVKLRHFDDKFTRLVDIHALPELKKIAAQDGKLFLGSGLTFAETMACEAVTQYIPVLAEACATVAGPQIRNMGTIGGNIANGAVSADTAAALLVLEPMLVIQGREGVRRAAMEGFHTGPGQVALAADEVLLGFEFDLAGLKGLGAAYYKYAMRSAMDIATIGCAAGVKMEGGRIADLRLAFTVAAPTPLRCRRAEAASLNQPLNDAAVAKIIAALEEDVQPRTSWRATREFRMRIIKTLAGRMIAAAAEGAKRGN